MAHPTRAIEAGRSGGRRRGGFTLVESLIASVVLAIAVIGVAGVMGTSFKHVEALDQGMTAVSLAKQLMEEIAAKPFLDPVLKTAPLGHEAAETTRASYNNIGDYDGYADESSGLQTPAGTNVSLGTGQSFTRRVTVEYRATPGGAAASSGDFARVTVTVTCPDGQVTTLSQLMCNLMVNR
ncbi:MAG TPA: prepilin-type N-terminal cleavage/methylation domain-containing protein [Tepidisphaeraceae bacterium]|jgi:prepilin-type N-terminal cleavage/methylation domain-containing protein